MTTYPSKHLMDFGVRDNALYTLIMDRQARNEDAVYMQHHAKSADLIRYNASRGMSRKAMAKIWPYRLLNLVLGHEDAK